MTNARWRLASLWISQNVLGLAFLFLELAAARALHRGEFDYSWQFAAVTLGAFVLLAPVNGLVSNSLPRRYVRTGSVGLIFLAACCFTRWPHFDRDCFGLAAVGFAIYSSAFYATLPAAAADARVALPRLMGLIKAAERLAEFVFFAPFLLLHWSAKIPGASALALIAVAGFASLPAAFPSDVSSGASLLREPLGFFRDCSRIWHTRAARSSLLALIVLEILTTAGWAAQTGPLDLKLILLQSGAILGYGVAAIQGHPRRCLGLVPFGATGLVIALGWASLAGPVPNGPEFLLVFASALATVPLRATYLAAVPPDTRGNAAAIMIAAIQVAGPPTVVFLTLFGIGSSLIAPLLAPLAVVAAAGACLAWVVLYPQAMEVAVEIVLLPIYRIHAHGPGAKRLPERGPLLIVANHSAYLDPFWLAKVAPRQIRPMMTSAFYDLPVVSWLSRHVARAIRVPTGSFRREAPELQEAIAALRAGECVVIFPEGMLRRSEDVLLRPFGRGVWHILHELPDTPVCAAWIEGSWGSYFSYKNGPPGKNKKPDRFHPIDIAFSEPHPADPTTLADHHTTRAWLRRAVLDCRVHLGLPVPDAAPAAEPAEEPAEEAPPVE